MPWVSRSVAIVSRIASSWVPSAARFRREVARSRVMVGCWFVVWKGKGRGSEVRHHLQDLAIVDAGRIPLDPIGRLTNVASDLTLSHAAHKLLPRGLPVATELHTRLGGVVEELIVLNPESDVPGFVVGPTVEIKSGVGHVLCLN